MPVFSSTIAIEVSAQNYFFLCTRA
jgi:hypothetical protein